MCEPMSASTAIGLGMSAVSTGLSIADRVSKQGTAQGNRDAALYTALTKTIPSINESLGQTYNSNQARAIQERDKTASEAFDVTRQMAEAKGAATAAAGDAGVGGVSFANILSDFEMREGLYEGKANYNYTAKVQQIADDSAASEAKAKSQINSVLNGAIAATPVPSTTSMWAGIGGDVVGAGLRIGDRFGLFDSKAKVDPATGRTYGGTAP